MSMQHSTLTVTALDYVPEFARGQVRDLRLRWALEEAGFTYEIDYVRFGEQAGAENLARQPFGQVPVLTVDGAPMFETGACVWRIAQASETLLPDDPSERDRCFSWLFAALNTIEPPITMLAVLRFVEQGPENWGVADGSAAATVAPAARQWIDMRLAQFSTALGDREHIVGGRFTAADLMLTAVLLPADRLGLLEGHARVKAYFDRHSSRAGFRKAQADQVAAFEANAAKYEGAA